MVTLLFVLKTLIKREFSEIEADMVVLSTAMEPSEGTKEIAEILNVGTTEDEFIKEAHPKSNL